MNAFRANPERFDLIISDQMMPNMTGQELAMNIRAINPRIPFILFTGFSTRVTEEKARNSGISAFVYKPVLKQGMAETIRRVLDGRM